MAVKIEKEEKGSTVMRTTLFGEVADGLNALAKQSGLSQADIVTAMFANALKTGVVIKTDKCTLGIEPGTTVAEIIEMFKDQAQKPAASSGKTKPKDVINALDSIMEEPDPVKKGAKKN